MMRVLLVLGLTVALAGLFVFGLQPRDARDVASPFTGKTLDDFEAPVIERYQEQYGESIRYSELIGQGKPLVVNFWASWCIPSCWNEAPRWKAAWAKYGDQVMILGVNFQDKVGDANDFLDRFNKPFPSVRDPKGSVGIAWGVFGVPETFFINSDGTLNYKQNGEISTEMIDTQIEALLR